MKTTLQCIKCESKRLWIIDKIMQPMEDRTNAHTLRVTAFARGWGGRRDVGHFEALICMQCGYTELYAQNLDGLRELATMEETGVRVIEPEPDNSGPYR